MEHYSIDPDDHRKRLKRAYERGQLEANMVLEGRLTQSKHTNPYYYGTREHEQWERGSANTLQSEQP